MHVPAHTHTAPPLAVLKALRGATHTTLPLLHPRTRHKCVLLLSSNKLNCARARDCMFICLCVQCALLVLISTHSFYPRDTSRIHRCKLGFKNCPTVDAVWEVRRILWARFAHKLTAAPLRRRTDARGCRKRSCAGSERAWLGLRAVGDTCGEPPCKSEAFIKSPRTRGLHQRLFVVQTRCREFDSPCDSCQLLSSPWLHKSKSASAGLSHCCVTPRNGQ